MMAAFDSRRFAAEPVAAALCVWLFQALPPDGRRPFRRKPLAPALAGAARRELPREAESTLRPNKRRRRKREHTANCPQPKPQTSRGQKSTNKQEFLGMEAKN
jgi:hypothetical protein